jgi:mRNA interferase MazF
MNYKIGDVILVEVLFSEKAESKKRPAVVLSSIKYHNNRQDVIIAAATSNTTRILYGDTLISDWKYAGLKFPSLVTGIIQTIKSSMIYKKLGNLSKQDLNNVCINISKSLGIKGL